MAVVLIGDSIRINSEPFIRANLPSSVEVLSPPENCESSHKVSAYIREWVPATNVDLIHLNFGLHDIRYDPGKNQRVSSPEEYRANLRAVFSYLSTTGAHIIWATSTPIDELMHNGIKPSRRYQSDLIEYNRISVSMAQDFGFSINDLHHKMSPFNLNALLLSDGLHFNTAGNELIGTIIADSIKDGLVPN
jgi:lysophospholipase L1-like esterase